MCLPGPPRDTGDVAAVDPEYVRTICNVHNAVRDDFPAVFARDFCHPDVEFVELTAPSGAATLAAARRPGGEGAAT